MPYNINLNSLAFWFWKASTVNKSIKIRDTSRDDYWLKSSASSATIDLYLVNIIRVLELIIVSKALIICAVVLESRNKDVFDKI